MNMLLMFAIGMLKGLAETNELTYDYMVECLGGKEKLEKIEKYVGYKTEERNGIIYVTDFYEK